MARIICPYCGTRQTFAPSDRECRECKTEIPVKYVQNVRKRPPVWMATIGNSQHGKTTYVDSLSLVLENLGKISRGTFSTYLDPNTFEKLRLIRVEAQEGRLPDSTPESANRPTPILISLPNFLGNVINTLVVYDLPGEVFDQPEMTAQYADAIRHAETIWFIISLADVLGDQQGRTIADLVQIYVDAMASIGADTKKRRILVVYTKADRIHNRLPIEIKNYLGKDPYRKIQQMTMGEANQTPFNEYEYTRNLYEISEQLKEFTYNEVPHGVDLINMIDFYGMELFFSIVASVPGVDGQTTGVDTPRHRVIDPLIWALTGQIKDNDDEKVALIVDAGQNTEDIYKFELPAEFFDALQSQNADVVTYFMGQSKPMTDQRPEKTPKKTLPNLLGPIIDHLPENTLIFVLTRNIPIDIYDYLHSSRHDKIFLFMTQDLNVQWSHKIILGEDDGDLYDLIHQVYQEAQNN